MKIKILRLDSLKRRVTRKDDDGSEFEPDDFDTMDVPEDDAADALGKMGDRFDAMAGHCRTLLKDRADLKKDNAAKDQKLADLQKAHDDETKALKAELEKVKGEKSTAEAKADDLQSKLTTAEKARNDAMDPATIEKVVGARLIVQRVGEHVIGKDFKIDAADRDLAQAKTAIVKAKVPELADAKLADKAYVDARFDGIAEDLGKVHVGLLSTRLIENLSAITGVREDADDPIGLQKAAEAAAKRQDERIANARAGK